MGTHFNYETSHVSGDLSTVCHKSCQYVHNINYKTRQANGNTPIKYHSQWEHNYETSQVNGNTHQLWNSTSQHGTWVRCAMNAVNTYTTSTIKDHKSMGTHSTMKHYKPTRTPVLRVTNPVNTHNYKTPRCNIHKIPLFPDFIRGNRVCHTFSRSVKLKGLPNTKLFPACQNCSWQYPATLLALLGSTMPLTLVQ